MDEGIDWSGTVECPICDSFGPHSKDRWGLYTCHECGTSFGADAGDGDGEAGSLRQ
jgi:hypothetical protein